MLIVKLVGSELRVSLIYTAPHQHPREAGGGGGRTDDAGKQEENSRERQLEGERRGDKQRAAYS